MVEGHPIERELCSTRNNWKALISNTGRSLDQGNSFLCIHLFSFLFKKQREREKERMRENFHLLFHFPKSPTRAGGWTRSKPGTRHLIWFSHTTRRLHNQEVGIRSSAGTKPKHSGIYIS